MISRNADNCARLEDESLRLDNDKSLPLDLSVVKKRFLTSNSKYDLHALDDSPNGRRRIDAPERTLTLNFNSQPTEGSTGRLLPGRSQNQLATTTSRQLKQSQTSPRDLLGSTIGASRASLLGTKQSDFFSDIDNDAELLQRFREAQKTRQAASRAKIAVFRQKEEGSNTARDESQLSKVRFNGLKTQFQGFTGRSKENLLKANKVSDLRQLADLFREQNMKDLKILEGKALELTQELNSITERNEKKQKVLYQLEETYERILKENADNASVIAPDVSQSVAKANSLEENFGALKNQETRLNQIIEICNVNKNQNDEWLRQLGFYGENLTKCIEEKCVEAKDADRVAGMADENFSKLKDRFKSSETNSQELLTALDQIQADNSVIQSHFMSTQKLIKRSFENTKKRLEERAEDRLKQLEENTRERAVSAKNRTVQRELNVWKETIQKYAPIFAYGEDGQPWNEKPEIKTLLENLSEKKELDKELMQLGFELKEKKMKNAELRRRIEVMNQSKLIHGANKDLEELKQEEADKLSQLELEKDKVNLFYLDCSIAGYLEIDAKGYSRR